MTEPEIRKMLVDAMLSASVFGVRDNGWTDAFLAGTRDIALGELEMDSLGAMELCIAVEVNTGVEIVPDELASMATLETLVATIHRELA
jgi:hypothetical protein